eukprot:113469_1
MEMMNEYFIFDTTDTFIKHHFFQPINDTTGAGTGTEEEEFNANLNVTSNYNSFNGDEALNPNPNAELNVDHAVMSETIERDLQRTFPRHSMFYDSYSEEDYDSSDEEEMGMDIG